MGELVVPFLMRGHAGEVRVAVTANDDPLGLGCDLLDRLLPEEAARGFPVCEATVVIDLAGYAGACGWVQLVRTSDTSGAFDMDPLALFRDVETPFAFFGIKPMLFDAPFRELRYDLSWKARSFLCAVPDAVMSKDVRPVAGFAWGFSVTSGAITIDPPATLDPAVWDEHLSLLQTSFPHWSFVPHAVG